MSQFHFAKYRRDERYTHYLFRFPAKFHPPVVRHLIHAYTGIGDSILDPFCGSGTLLVEALLAGRNAVGLDVDPVAAFISRVKCTPLSPRELERAFNALQRDVQRVRRSRTEYDRLIHTDLSPHSINRLRRRFG